MSKIFSFFLDISAEKLNILLQLCLSFAAAMYKFQTCHSGMAAKSLICVLDCDTRDHSVTLCYDRKLCFDLSGQFFQILFDGFFPYKGIPIGIGFQLCSVHEHIPEPHLTEHA